MKALILVGGFGTRLRPLTENRPKPLVEFCNLPMMTYQMKELIKAGVNHIILAVSYKADQMNRFVEEQEKLFGIKITLSHETEPLGTAGPLALARDQLLSSTTNTTATTIITTTKTPTTTAETNHSNTDRAKQLINSNSNDERSNNNKNIYNHCNGDCKDDKNNKIDRKKQEALKAADVNSSSNRASNNNDQNSNDNGNSIINDGGGDVIDDGVPFFVLNSDIICNYPFEQMLQFHKQNKGEGTIVVTRVEEPSKYGVVVYESSSGLVERFVEKPSTFVSDKINAGLYILSKSILKRIKLEPTSIEREIFPAMAADKKLFATDLEGYWMDVGQPPDYLRGVGLYLNWLSSTKLAIKSQLAKSSNDNKKIIIQGNVLIDPSAIIGDNCIIGPDVCIGPNVTVDKNSKIRHSTILGGASLSSDVDIDNSIVGWTCQIGEGVKLSNTCVLGENVKVCDAVCLSKARVWPNKTISESISEPIDIM